MVFGKWDATDFRREEGPVAAALPRPGTAASDASPALQRAKQEARRVRAVANGTRSHQQPQLGSVSSTRRILGSRHASQQSFSSSAVGASSHFDSQQWSRDSTWEDQDLQLKRSEHALRLWSVPSTSDSTPGLLKAQPYLLPSKTSVACLHRGGWSDASTGFGLEGLDGSEASDASAKVLLSQTSVVSLAHASSSALSSSSKVPEDKPTIILCNGEADDDDFGRDLNINEAVELMANSNIPGSAASDMLAKMTSCTDFSAPSGFSRRYFATCELYGKLLDQVKDVTDRMKESTFEYQDDEHDMDRMLYGDDSPSMDRSKRGNVAAKDDFKKEGLNQILKKVTDDLGKINFASMTSDLKKWVQSSEASDTLLRRLLEETGDAQKETANLLSLHKFIVDEYLSIHLMEAARALADFHENIDQRLHWVCENCGVDDSLALMTANDKMKDLQKKDVFADVEDDALAAENPDLNKQQKILLAMRVTSNRTHKRTMIQLHDVQEEHSRKITLNRSLYDHMMLTALNEGATRQEPPKLRNLEQRRRASIHAPAPTLVVCATKFFDEPKQEAPSEEAEGDSAEESGTRPKIKIPERSVSNAQLQPGPQTPNQQSRQVDLTAARLLSTAKIHFGDIAGLYAERNSLLDLAMKLVKKSSVPEAVTTPAAASLTEGGKYTKQIRMLRSMTSTLRATKTPGDSVEYQWLRVKRERLWSDLNNVVVEVSIEDIMKDEPPDSPLWDTFQFKKVSLKELDSSKLQIQGSASGYGNPLSPSGSARPPLSPAGSARPLLSPSGSTLSESFQLASPRGRRRGALVGSPSKGQAKRQLYRGDAPPQVLQDLKEMKDAKAEGFSELMERQAKFVQQVHTDFGPDLWDLSEEAQTINFDVNPWSYIVNMVSIAIKDLTTYLPMLKKNMLLERLGPISKQLEKLKEDLANEHISQREENRKTKLASQLKLQDDIPPWSEEELTRRARTGERIDIFQERMITFMEEVNAVDIDAFYGENLRSTSKDFTMMTVAAEEATTKVEELTWQLDDAKDKTKEMEFEKVTLDFLIDGYPILKRLNLNVASNKDKLAMLRNASQEVAADASGAFELLKAEFLSSEAAEAAAAKAAAIAADKEEVEEGFLGKRGRPSLELTEGSPTKERRLQELLQKPVKEAPPPPTTMEAAQQAVSKAMGSGSGMGRKKESLAEKARALKALGDANKVKSMIVAATQKCKILALRTLRKKQELKALMEKAKLAVQPKGAAAGVAIASMATAEGWEKKMNGIKNIIRGQQKMMEFWSQRYEKWHTEVSSRYGLEVLEELMFYCQEDANDKDAEALTEAVRRWFALNIQVTEVREKTFKDRKVLANKLFDKYQPVGEDLGEGVEAKPDIADAMRLDDLPGRGPGKLVKSGGFVLMDLEGTGDDTGRTKGSFAKDAGIRKQPPPPLGDDLGFQVGLPGAGDSLPSKQQRSSLKASAMLASKNIFGDLDLVGPQSHRQSDFPLSPSQSPKGLQRKRRDKMDEEWNADAEDTLTKLQHRRRRAKTMSDKGEESPNGTNRQKKMSVFAQFMSDVNPGDNKKALKKSKSFQDALQGVPKKGGMLKGASFSGLQSVLWVRKDGEEDSDLDDSFPNNSSEEETVDRHVDEEAFWEVQDASQTTLHRLRSCREKLVQRFGSIDRAYAKLVPALIGLTRGIFFQMLRKMGFQQEHAVEMHSQLLRIMPPNRTRSNIKVPNLMIGSRAPAGGRGSSGVAEEAISRPDFADALRRTGPVRTLVQLRTRLRLKYHHVEAAMAACFERQKVVTAAHFREFLANLGIAGLEAKKLFEEIADNNLVARQETDDVDDGEVNQELPEGDVPQGASSGLLKEITRNAFLMSLMHAEGLENGKFLKAVLIKGIGGTRGMTGAAARGRRGAVTLSGALLGKLGVSSLEDVALFGRQVSKSSQLSDSQQRQVSVLPDLPEVGSQRRRSSVFRGGMLFETPLQQQQLQNHSAGSSPVVNRGFHSGSPTETLLRATGSDSDRRRTSLSAARRSSFAARGSLQAATGYTDLRRKSVMPSAGLQQDGSKESLQSGQGTGIVSVKSIVFPENAFGSLPDMPPISRRRSSIASRRRSSIASQRRSSFAQAPEADRHTVVLREMLAMPAIPQTQGIHSFFHSASGFSDSDSSGFDSSLSPSRIPSNESSKEAANISVTEGDQSDRVSRSSSKGMPARGRGSKSPDANQGGSFLSRQASHSLARQASFGATSRGSSLFSKLSSKGQMQRLISAQDQQQVDHATHLSYIKSMLVAFREIVLGASVAPWTPISRDEFVAALKSVKGLSSEGAKALFMMSSGNSRQTDVLVSPSDVLLHVLGGLGERYHKLREDLGLPSARHATASLEVDSKSHGRLRTGRLSANRSSKGIIALSLSFKSRKSIQKKSVSAGLLAEFGVGKPADGNRKRQSTVIRGSTASRKRQSTVIRGSTASRKTLLAFGDPGADMPAAAQPPKLAKSLFARVVAKITQLRSILSKPKGAAEDIKAPCGGPVSSSSSWSRNDSGAEGGSDDPGAESSAADDFLSKLGAAWVGRLAAQQSRGVSFAAAQETIVLTPAAFSRQTSGSAPVASGMFRDIAGVLVSKESKPAREKIEKKFGMSDLDFMLGARSPEPSNKVDIKAQQNAPATQSPTPKGLLLPFWPASPTSPSAGRLVTSPPATSHYEFENENAIHNWSQAAEDAEGGFCASSSSASENNFAQAEQRNVLARLRLFEGNTREFNIALAAHQQALGQLMKAAKGQPVRAFERLQGSGPPGLSAAALQEALAKALKLTPLDAGRIATVAMAVENTPTLDYHAFLRVLRFAKPVSTLLELRVRFVQRFGSAAAAIDALEAAGLRSGEDYSVDQFERVMSGFGILEANANKLFQEIDALQAGGPTGFLTLKGIRFAADKAQTTRWLDSWQLRLGGHLVAREFLEEAAAACGGLDAPLASAENLGALMCPLGFPQEFVAPTFSMLKERLGTASEDMLTVEVLLSVLQALSDDHQASLFRLCNAEMSGPPRSASGHLEVHQGQSPRSTAGATSMEDPVREEAALEAAQQLRRQLKGKFGNFQEAYDGLGPTVPSEGVTLEEWQAQRQPLFGEVWDPERWNLVFGRLVDWQHSRWNKKYLGIPPKVTLDILASLNQLAPCLTLSAVRARFQTHFNSSLSKAWAAITGSETADEVSVTQWRQGLLALGIRSVDALQIFALIMVSPFNFNSGAVKEIPQGGHVLDGRNMPRLAFLSALRAPFAEGITKLLKLLNRPGSSVSSGHGPASACFETSYPREPLAVEQFQAAVSGFLPGACSAEDARMFFQCLDVHKEGRVAIDDLLETMSALQACYLPGLTVPLPREPSSVKRLIRKRSSGLSPKHSVVGGSKWGIAKAGLSAVSALSHLKPGTPRVGVGSPFDALRDTRSTMVPSPMPQDLESDRATGSALADSMDGLPVTLQKSSRPSTSPGGPSVPETLFLSRPTTSPGGPLVQARLGSAWTPRASVRRQAPLNVAGMSERKSSGDGADSSTQMPGGKLAGQSDDAIGPGAGTTTLPPVLEGWSFGHGAVSPKKSLPLPKGQLQRSLQSPSSASDASEAGTPTPRADVRSPPVLDVKRRLSLEMSGAVGRWHQEAKVAGPQKRPSDLAASRTLPKMAETPRGSTLGTELSFFSVANSRSLRKNEPLQ